MFLTDDELTTLTGYKVKAKRLAALDKLEIPYIVNPRGHIVVRSDWESNLIPDEFVPGEIS